jgi:hypothetical protein
MRDHLKPETARGGAEPETHERNYGMRLTKLMLPVALGG